jgi:hypothetical protein
LSRKSRLFAPARRFGRSYVPAIVAFTLLAVFLAVIVFRPSEKSARAPKPKSDTSNDSQSQLKPSIPEGWVSVGGVYRPSSDVATNQKQAEGESTIAYKMIQGYSPDIDPNTNAQTQVVAASLKTRENPERFSSFIVPKSFDADAFKADPKGYAESYAAIVEPGRVFASAQPGEGISSISTNSSRLHRVKQGESVTLTAKAIPYAPVSFWTENLGSFENKLTAITVVADENGDASTTFLASGGTIHEVNVLASSPVTSGQLRFIVSVRIPE